MLSVKINHPRERVTLIFSGKILKDPETIASYGKKFCSLGFACRLFQELKTGWLSTWFCAQLNQLNLLPLPQPPRPLR